MKTPLLFFSVLAILYVCHDLVLRKIFSRKYSKNDNFIGNHAGNNIQQYFGKALYLTMIYYLIILIYLITDFDLWGLVSNVYLLDNTILQWIGFISGLLFLILMTLARLNLGSSWRIGLDYQTKDDLIKGGFYKYIRNPYFLFLLGFQFSLIPIVPNAIMMGSFIQSTILLGLQVRFEEAFLQEKYGDEYLKYKEKTGRFFPVFRYK